MIDKELFKLIGGNKKYIFIAVLLQAIGLIANVNGERLLCRVPVDAERRMDTIYLSAYRRGYRYYRKI